MWWEEKEDKRGRRERSSSNDVLPPVVIVRPLRPLVIHAMAVIGTRRYREKEEQKDE